MEISHGILALPTGRLLAPAATIEHGRLGEHVLVAISDDGGATWPRTALAFDDPDDVLGYLEQKLTLLGDGKVLATAWTVTLDGLVDQPNSYSLSFDDGETWTRPRSMGTNGQTLSTVHLGDDRFLLLYNRRYGEQGIVAAVARLQRQRLDGDDWLVVDETLLYDPGSRRQGRQRPDGVSEMLDFEFGFPTATLRRDGTIMATYWSVEDGAAACGGPHSRSIRELCAGATARLRQVPTERADRGHFVGTSRRRQRYPGQRQMLDQLVQRLVGVGDAGGGADEPVETELAPPGDLGDTTLGIGGDVHVHDRRHVGLLHHALAAGAR